MNTPISFLHTMSYMNHLPSAWIVLDPGMKLIKRGNVYCSQPVEEKPVKRTSNRPKSPKSTKKPT